MAATSFEQDAETFFDKDKFYDAVPEDGSIALVSFLAKTQQITYVFDAFGMVFSAVKNDMNNNIVKMNKAMDTKKQSGGEYKSIQELIEDEMARKVYEDKNSGTVAAVWLGRGLKFMYLFFEQLVMAHKNGITAESNTEFVKVAYEGSLKQYHNFISKGVFKVACHAAPNRSALCKNLMKSPVPDGTDAQLINKVVIGEMEAYLVNLKDTADTWNRVCMDITKDKYKDL